MTFDLLPLADGAVVQLNRGRKGDARTIMSSDVATTSKVFLRATADALTTSDQVTTLRSIVRSASDAVGLADLATIPVAQPAFAGGVPPSHSQPWPVAWPVLPTTAPDPVAAVSTVRQFLAISDVASIKVVENDDWIVLDDLLLAA